MPSHLWNILPGESLRAFAAFSVYLNLGPERSFPAAYRVYKDRPDVTGRHAPGYIAKWAHKNRWVERARAWDIHAQEVARSAQDAELSKEGQDLARRRLSGYKALLSVGAQIVVKSAQDLANLSPEEARRLLPVAAHMIQVGAVGIRAEFGPNPAIGIPGIPMAGVRVQVGARGEVNITALVGDVAQVLQDAGEPFNPLGGDFLDSEPLAQSMLQPSPHVSTNGKNPDVLKERP